MQGTNHGLYLTHFLAFLMGYYRPLFLYFRLLDTVDTKLLAWDRLKSSPYYSGLAKACLGLRQKIRCLALTAVQI